jgi:hypothetical protein
MPRRHVSFFVLLLSCMYQSLTIICVSIYCKRDCSQHKRGRKRVNELVFSASDATGGTSERDVLMKLEQGAPAPLLCLKCIRIHTTVVFKVQSNIYTTYSRGHQNSKNLAS